MPMRKEGKDLWLELGLSDLAIHARQGKFIGLVSSAKYYLTFKSLVAIERCHRRDFDLLTLNYTKIITRRGPSGYRVNNSFR